MKLQLHILAQALEDVLRYELGLPLVGASARGRHRELIYWEALDFLSQYQGLMLRWTRTTEPGRQRWLKEIENARESVC